VGLQCRYLSAYHSGHRLVVALELFHCCSSSALCYQLAPVRLRLDRGLRVSLCRGHARGGGLGVYREALCQCPSQCRRAARKICRWIRLLLTYSLQVVSPSIRLHVHCNLIPAGEALGCCSCKSLSRTMSSPVDLLRLRLIRDETTHVVSDDRPGSRTT
jgi:hypothetical protein